MPVQGTPIPIQTATYDWKSARLKSNGDLKDYVLTRLGSPVINIEITDKQLDFCIMDTIEMYCQKAYAGVVESYIPIQLLKGISTYQLPYNIFAVLRVESATLGGIATGGAPSNLFSLNQFIAADLYRGTGKIDIITFEMTNQMISTLNLMFSKTHTFDYNCISRELKLFEIPYADENVLIHVYSKAYPDQDEFGVENTNIYSEMWIRDMAVEKARYQWASNLSKYNGTTLPGGIQLDVPTILNEAKENIIKLEEKLNDEYQLPTDFFVGVLSYLMLGTTLLLSMFFNIPPIL